MKQIDLEFETNANSTGLQQFRRLKHGVNPQGKNVYIYVRTHAQGHNLGKVFGYEAFIPTISKAGTIQKFPNGTLKTIEEDTENYPGASQFGRNAYFCISLESAEKRFAEMMGQAVVAEEESVEEVAEKNSDTAPEEPKRRKRNSSLTTLTFPEGEFSTQSMAELNGVEYYVVANFMKKNPDKFQFVRERRVENAKRPTKFFRKTT